MPSLHDFSVDSAAGEPVALSHYAGQLCLVVNLASRCGLTPQYAGLEELHETYREKGFSVLGFPCNQFGGQEPGTNAEICEFAKTRYGAEFPIFAKIEVNGPGACDLYRFLKAGHPDEQGNEEIAWNFTKFLVGRDGQVIARYGPTTPPDEIAEVLAQQL